MLGAIVAGAAAGLASIPHCAGMCGPLAAYACGGRPRAHAPYHLGRLASYAFTGALAGTFGGAALAWLERPIAQAILSWTLALGLALAAWRLWRSPAARPADALVQLRSKPEAQRSGRLRAPLLGLFTGFLPCGALAAGLMLSAGSGSTLGGSLTMLAFAATSSLGLLGAGVAARKLAGAGEAPRKVLAVALALGATILILRPVDALRGESSSCHSAAPITATGDALARR